MQELLRELAEYGYDDEILAEILSNYEIKKKSSVEINLEKMLKINKEEKPEKWSEKLFNAEQRLDILVELRALNYGKWNQEVESTHKWINFCEQQKRNKE